MKKIAFVGCMLAMFMLAGGLASCSNEIDVLENNSELTRSLYDDYQNSEVEDVDAEMVSVNSDFDLNSLPVMTGCEMFGLLKKLDGLVVDETCKKCGVSVNGMTAYTLSTSGQITGSDGVAVDIDFISYADDNSLYYKGNRLTATGDNMYMAAKGFSLSTENNLYKVVITGCVYFNLIGDDKQTAVVSVPVRLEGKLDVTNDSCTYTCKL